MRPFQPEYGNGMPSEDTATPMHPPSPPISPVPAIGNKLAAKPNPERKRIPEKQMTSLSPTPLVTSQDGLLPLAPKPPPLPIGPLSHSAQELNRKKPWNLRQPEPTLVPMNERASSPILNPNIARPQQLQYQQKQPLLQTPVHSLPSHLQQHPVQLTAPAAAKIPPSPLLPLPIDMKPNPTKQAAQPPKLQPAHLQSYPHSQFQGPPPPPPALLHQPQRKSQSHSQIHKIQEKLQEKTPEKLPDKILDKSQENFKPREQQEKGIVQSHPQSPSLQSPHSTALQSSSNPAPQSLWSPQLASNRYRAPSPVNYSTSNIPSNNTTATSTTPSNSYSVTELKKRGIHRRDLVKGTTALPPNMVFVPKKRPAPLLPTPPPFPYQQDPETISSPLSPKPRRHSSGPMPVFRRGENEGEEQEPNNPQGSGLHGSEGTSNGVSSISVGSLGGISLRGVNMQRKETIGVIGSGKTIHSPPTPPPYNQSRSTLSPSSDVVAFLVESSESPSSLFSGSRSPLHFSSPLPSSTAPPTSLRNSSPLPSTYDLFAPSPNPLFTPSMFDSPFNSSAHPVSAITTILTHPITMDQHHQHSLYDSDAAQN